MHIDNLMSFCTYLFYIYVNPFIAVDFNFFFFNFRSFVRSSYKHVKIFSVIIPTPRLLQGNNVDIFTGAACVFGKMKTLTQIKLRTEGDTFFWLHIVPKKYLSAVRTIVIKFVVNLIF